MHYSVTPYTTPEEFNEPLFAHFNDTLLVKVNGKNVPFKRGAVNLGHETSVVFHNINLPLNTKVIQVVNGAVKDIYRHTTKLYVPLIDLTKTPYILNKPNDFTAEFSID